MSLVGAFILPHGAMLLDPHKKGVPDSVTELHQGMKKAAKMIDALQPELIFLTAPHCISLSKDFGIYLNKIGEGTAEWKGDYTEFTIQIKFNQDLASRLLDFLKEQDENVTGITTYSSGASVPLRWGTTVPLWFLRNLSSDPQYLLFSQPTRRHDRAPEMISEVLRLGGKLRSFFQHLQHRVVVIASADLAHTHSTKGPYHYSDQASRFDQIIEDWAASLTPELLLNKAKQLLEDALCCGYVGFVMLQGLLKNVDFHPKVLGRAAPTYYGMLIASYTASNWNNL